MLRGFSQTPSGLLTALKIVHFARNFLLLTIFKALFLY